MVSLSKQIVISGYLLSFTVHGDLVRQVFLKRTHLIVCFFSSRSFRFSWSLKLILKLLASRACHFKALYGHFPKSFHPVYLAPYFGTRNITFEAYLFWCMAERTRNVTFEAYLFCCTAYRTRNITFEAH